MLIFRLVSLAQFLGFISCLQLDLLQPQGISGRNIESVIRLTDVAGNKIPILAGDQYGYFHLAKRANPRFIPLPLGHQCQGEWLQYGSVRASFTYYNGEFRFGSYCLDTGAVTFLENGGAATIGSISQANPAPNGFSPFYQICVARGGSAPMPGPIFDWPNANNGNGYAPPQQGKPQHQRAPQEPVYPLGTGSKQQAPGSVYNFGCGENFFTAVDCIMNNGKGNKGKPEYQPVDNGWKAPVPSEYVTPPIPTPGFPTLIPTTNRPEYTPPVPGTDFPYYNTYLDSTTVTSSATGSTKIRIIFLFAAMLFVF
ncbi:unnamed protein product, partial [Mesorhabditis spiculigera]